MIDLNKKLQLSNNAVLREEHFGGLIFNKKDKSIMELNKFSYILLSDIECGHSGNQLLKKANSLNISEDDIIKYLNDLYHLELICYASAICSYRIDIRNNKKM